MNSKPLRKLYDFSQIDPGLGYRLMVGAIVPRPVAWISTISPDGKTNLAPFSFFMGVSSTPPCIAVSITRKLGLDRNVVEKDTFRNILSTREFVVNVSTEENADLINATSIDLEYEESEFDAFGLTPEPSVFIKAPRVAESPIQIECVLEKSIEIGDDGIGSSHLIIGRIKAMHVREDLLTASGPYLDIDVQKLKPISRLGGQEWGKTREVFTLKRPK